VRAARLDKALDLPTGALRTSGPTRHARLRRLWEQKLLWPLLDLRDFVLRRGDDSKPLYAVHHVSRWVRFRWAMLDAWDKVRFSVGRVRATRFATAAAAVLALALLGGAAYAAFSGGGEQGSGSETADATPAKRVAAPAPPRIEVAGVIESSEKISERKAKRAERRRAARRRAERRERAADRRRAARRRAAKRKRAARARSAPVPASAPAETPPPTPAADPPSTNTQPSAPSPAPAPPAPPPSSGGGGGGGGGGGRPPSQPQPSPGVEFDDTG
jgi:hypothetical protein